MAQSIVKDGKTFLTMEVGCPIPPEFLALAEWGQKTAPTKIFRAFPGEDISQASGERGLVIAKGTEIVFDNGFIPIKYGPNGNVTDVRHDIFIPTDSNGQSTGAEVRDRDYRLIAKGVEQATLPGFSGGETEARDYGMYMPMPNPQAVIKSSQPICILNAFGPNDHQWLDEPILRLQQKDSAWSLKGGINGPEFKSTWTTFAPLGQINRDEAKFHAGLALKSAERRYKAKHIWNVIKSIPLRFAFSHWRSRPETPSVR